MYTLGGLYIDVDNTLLKSLEPLFVDNGDIILTTRPYENKDVLSTNIIYTLFKNHPFWAFCLNKYVQNMNNKVKISDTLFLQHCYDKWTIVKDHLSDVNVISSNIVHPFDLKNDKNKNCNINDNLFDHQTCISNYNNMYNVYGISHYASIK